MYLLREYHERIDRINCSRSRMSFVAGWGLLTLAMALLGVVFLWMGAPITSGSVMDAPMYLDGAWRILHGQTPHKDFYVYFGDLPFYVGWLGMKLGRPGIGALTCGN